MAPSAAVRMAWAGACLQNKSNPHVPKFVSPKVHKLDNRFNYIRMEKLTPMSNSLPNNEFAAELKQLVYTMVGDGTNSIDAIRDMVKYSDSPRVLAYAEANPKFYEAIYLVVAVSRKMGYKDNDIALNNLMMRGNDIVITDPLA